MKLKNNEKCQSIVVSNVNIMYNSQYIYINRPTFSNMPIWPDPRNIIMKLSYISDDYLFTWNMNMFALYELCIKYSLLNKIRKKTHHGCMIYSELFHNLFLWCDEVSL